MSPIHRRLRITGLVRGVWYRRSAVGKGTSLGLDGTARNLTDGSVEVHAEGDPVAMDEFIAWCQRGPARARVDQVLVEPSSLMGFQTFTAVH